MLTLGWISCSSTNSALTVLNVKPTLKPVPFIIVCSMPVLAVVRQRGNQHRVPSLAGDYLGDPPFAYRVSRPLGGSRGDFEAQGSFLPCPSHSARHRGRWHRLSLSELSTSPRLDLRFRSRIPSHPPALQTEQRSQYLFSRHRSHHAATVPVVPIPVSDSGTPRSCNRRRGAEVGEFRMTRPAGGARTPVFEFFIEMRPCSAATSALAISSTSSSGSSRLGYQQ